MTIPDDWIAEKWPSVEIRYKVKSVLHDEKTAFQHMRLVDTFHYGRMLFLDGVVQTSEKDEFVYHEMMTHIPLMSHPDPHDVLIIGGGDGGVLREVLRHPSVENAVMVEIDSTVIDFSKKYLPFISNGAFDNERSEIVIGDGAAYVKNTDRKFDIVIVDSPDPVGPAQVLFSKKFYSDIATILNPGGIMVRQTGSTYLQPDEQKQTFGLLKSIFRYTAFYVYAVPTYIGGLFSTVFCSADINPEDTTIDQLIQKKIEKQLETRYYNPGLHLGAFHIPGFMKDNLS